MLNLIGDFPDSSEVLAVRDAHLHLYGRRGGPAANSGTYAARRLAGTTGLAARELPTFFHRPEFAWRPR